MPVNTIIPEYELATNQVTELASRLGSTIESRLRAFEELANNANSHPIGETTYNYIFQHTSDLLDKSQLIETRQRVWRLYTQLVNGFSENVGQVRYHMFDLIHRYEAQDEEIPLIVDFILALTEKGKNVGYYEADIGDWVDHLITSFFVAKTSRGFQVKKYAPNVQRTFLHFLNNMIKFNAACIQLSKPQALNKMIRYACQLAYQSQELNELDQIYEFLNVVLSYSHVPTETLSQVVVCLCIGVNRKELYQVCNKMARNLVGTYLGYTTITTLHHIIEDEINFTDPALIRGGIYFLVHSLWGELKPDNFLLSPNSVMPALHNLVTNEAVANPVLIALEVANGIYLFIANFSSSENNMRKELLHARPRSSMQEQHICQLILWEHTWHSMLDIVHSLAYRFLLPRNEKESSQLITLIISIVNKLKEVLDCYNTEIDGSNSNDNYSALSEIFKNDKFVERSLVILELAINHLGEESIFNLISHRIGQIVQNRGINWLPKVKHLIDVYFISNQNHKVRLQCLNELQKLLSTSYYFVDVDIFWEKVASSYFNQPVDTTSRELAINFLTFIAHKSQSLKTLNDLIDIFEQTVSVRLKFNRQHSFELSTTRSHHSQIAHQLSAPTSLETSQFNDVVQSIAGLVVIFREKFYHPTCHPVAINAFRILVKFATSISKLHSDEMHSNLARALPLIKQKIFYAILALRTNSCGQVGLANDRQVVSSPQLNHLTNFEEVIQFSHYISVHDLVLAGSVTSPITSPQQSSHSSHQPLQRQQSIASQPNISVMFHTSLVDALRLIIECIASETDWSVLQLILTELPKVLKHKGIMLAATASHSNTTSPSSSMTHLNPLDSIPDLLVTTLCNFIESLQARLNIFHFGDTKVTKVDVLALVYNSVSALVNYKLLSSNQATLIKLLQNGLVQFSSKVLCIRQCIISLTICSMEMQTAMNKFLPDIILTLSKISVSKALAVPKLEFLSNIILFPDLYYSFINKQYLSIFMISQSYINPYKYGEYTVALALRVISMWFLKCPLNWRRDLVPVLINAFNTNMLKEVEPNQRFHGTSDRLSNTISTNTSSAFVNVSKPEGMILDPNDKENSKIEIVEVCMDMLASNTYTTSAPLPLKPSMIDRLLNKEKSQMWLVGHKLIQITTTGCTSRALRNSLCNKCLNICHMNELVKSETREVPFSSNFPGQQNFGALLNDRITSQFSCDLPNQANIASATSSSRRRHRSEIHSSHAQKINFNHDFKDDHNFPNKIPTASSSESDLNVESKYCRCWCQSWAEILIRRATGDTRMIVRIENSLGDFPYWSFSKEEDDSLAQIFQHAEPEINLALQMQKSIDSESCEKLMSMDNMPESPNDETFESQATLTCVASVSAAAVTSSSKAKNSVARAASFGSRSPHLANSHMKSGELSSHEKARSNVSRRLEKDFSFEEPVTPEGGSQSSLTLTGDDSTSTLTNSAGQYRDRGFTISVMSPAQAKSAHKSESSISGSTSSLYRQPVSPAGLTPQYVFLQLFYNSAIRDEMSLSREDKPIMLDKNDRRVKNAITCLDLVTPYETHKIGVLYVGPGQNCSKEDILSNQMGSFRYTRFLKDIGQLISLEDVDQKVCYLGGLDPRTDGPYAISWGDHLVQMIFHVATLMPSIPTDPKFNNKYRHIGNDFVTIVYNNSGEKFDFTSIPNGFGKMIKAMVVITPLEYKSNLVEVQAVSDFAEFIGSLESQVISDLALPVYARQLALQINIAAMVRNDGFAGLKSYHIYNWVTRLRKVKKLRSQALDQLQQPVESGSLRNMGGSQSAPSSVHARVRLTQRVESRDDGEPSCMLSPNPPNSATSNGLFDYDSSGPQQLSVPDFIAFTRLKNKDKD